MASLNQPVLQNKACCKLTVYRKIFCDAVFVFVSSAGLVQSSSALFFGDHEREEDRERGQGVTLVTEMSARHEILVHMLDNHGSHVLGGVCHRRQQDAQNCEGTQLSISDNRKCHVLCRYVFLYKVSVKCKGCQTWQSTVTDMFLTSTNHVFYL